MAQVAPNPLGSQSGSPAPAAIARPVRDQPQITRQKQFSIPYYSNQQSGANNRPGEVQLLVSNDRGINWIPYRRQSTTANQFFFQASADGEYWFAMQHLSSNGQSAPPGTIHQPELKVLVDSEGPKLTLELEPLSTGEVIARWAVRDMSIDPSKILLSYQSSPQLPPQGVRLDAQNAYRENGIVAGETRWFPQTTNRILLVRLEAHDLAGNVETVQRNTPVSLVAMRPEWNRITGQKEVPRNDVYYGVPPQSANQLPRDPFLQRNPIAQQPKQGRIPWPANNQPQQLATGNNPSPQPPNIGTPNPSPVPQNQFTQNPTPTQPRQPGIGVFEPASGPTSPPVGNASTVRPQAKQSKLPPGIELEMSDSKKFALNYSVDTVGPSGVGRVELWVTKDGGRVWEPNGVDPDRTSPIEVEVKEEGVFGFRVVVEGGNGLAGQRPKPGDLADIWVGIDQQIPQVSITSVVYGEGARVGELDIDWVAEDAHLEDRPIQIFYSATKVGPWKLIENSIENQGQYSWRITPEVPADIYLKVQATDKAGNVGEYILTQPIENDGLVPQGRVRSIKPIRSLSDQAGLPVTIR
ncbi:MAG: hypothetical protein ACKVH8_18565 [Pirellulales bacterium]